MQVQSTAAPRLHRPQLRPAELGKPRFVTPPRDTLALSDVQELARASARALVHVGGLAYSGLQSALDVARGAGVALHDLLTGETRARNSAHQAVAAIRRQDLSKLSDTELKARTPWLRARLQAGENLDDLLVDAYATAREAARRATGLSAYDEQILGAVHAHRGAIVEMKTGEGKTLMEVMPAYLNALTGTGVHIVTANDYLAQRDRDWMGPVFERLGLTAEVILPGQTPEQRRKANQADITYGTASEFGFQYLNDNLVADKSERVGRDLAGVFALVDEADSLLLDEARTPMIIADRVAEDPRPAQVMAAVARHLGPQDVEVDARLRTAVLSEQGIETAQKLLGWSNLYDPQHAEMLPYLYSAVQARALFHKNQHYVVHDGKVTLVDEFTGRLKPGHRFADGLHQAIEAREGLPIGPTQRTMASITHPNYFRLYRKVSGMTGTAQAAAEEFREIFGLPVRAIPTHRPCVRQDQPDLMFATSRERDAALIEHVKALHAAGRPVLIGVRSIERAQELSAQLGVPHNVLNALNAGKEAAIIARAGQPGAVTIATNMAGRGVDIKLGPGVRARGGLRVILTERHESRRIDEQFIGRAGRQGDPGSSQAYLSQEDELFRRFGPTVPIAQRAAESRNLESRSRLLQYDSVVHLQRQAVYAEREAVLNGAPIPLNAMAELVAQSAYDRHFTTGGPVNRPQLAREVAYLLNKNVTPPETGFKSWLQTELQSALSAKAQQVPLGEIAREIYLRSLDDEWASQQTALDAARDGSWTQAYAEKDPLREYMAEAKRLYDGMTERVAARTIHAALSIQPASPGTGRTPTPPS